MVGTPYLLICNLTTDHFYIFHGIYIAVLWETWNAGHFPQEVVFLLNVLPVRCVSVYWVSTVCESLFDTHWMQICISCKVLPVSTTWSASPSFPVRDCIFLSWLVRTGAAGYAWVLGKMRESSVMNDLKMIPLLCRIQRYFLDLLVLLLLVMIITVIYWAPTVCQVLYMHTLT